MRFGLFGSAQARRGGPDVDSGAGFRDFVAYNLGQFSSVEQIGERIAIFKEAVEAQGRVFDPMTVGVARSLNIVTTKAEYEQAIENRILGRYRTYRLADREARTRTDAEVREAAEAGTLYGTPEEVAVKLQALRAVGAEYVLLNSAGGLASLRRFAHEILPAFAGTLPLRTAV